MKKIKKMLAGLLGAAMVLTSFGTPAWATSTKSPTIDASKTGSIIIHKYEYNGAQDSLKTGTGQDTDEETIPGGATVLKGVKFEAYKLADISQDTVTGSDGKKSTALQYTNIIHGLADRDFNENTTYDSIKDKITESSLTVAGTATTNESGIATINNLGLGVYLVKEVDAPSQVTNKTANFIVSIPTTNTVTDSTNNTKYGDNWIYDVNVYPKNATNYGDVKLKKVGKTAGSNSEKALQSVKFILQQEVTGATSTTTWETCKTGTTKGENNADVVNTTGEYITGADGVLSVGGLAPGKYRFIETDLASNDGYIMDGKNTYVFTISIGTDGAKNITLETNSYATLDSVSNTIIVTNEKPDMKKEVKRREQTAEGKDNWQHDADYSVGDMVPYRITIDVPSNIAQLKEFTLKDTPTNLMDDADSISIKYGENKIDSKAWSKETDTNKIPANGFKINFVPAEMTAYAGKQIVVSYNAKLLDTAKTTTAGNPNTATLEYSNNILPDTTDTTNPNHDKEQGKDKIEDTAVVYTFKLNIHKTDASTNKTPLKGVEFDLYKEVSNITTGVITGNSASTLGLESNKKWLKINTDKLVTDQDGNIAQSGLANGDYYLVETKTNEGFNLLKSPVHVVLNIEYSTTWTKESEWVDETVDGKTVRKLVKHSEDKKTTTFTKSTNSTGEVQADTGTMTETIINRKGFTLPKTGDIGTVMFLIIGIGGMLAAVYIMLRGRKRA